MAHEQIEAFRQMVLHNLELQSQLRTTADWESFVALTVRLGQEHGFWFTVEELELILRANRRVWVQG